MRIESSAKEKISTKHFPQAPLKTAKKILNLYLDIILLRIPCSFMILKKYNFDYKRRIITFGVMHKISHFVKWPAVTIMDSNPLGVFGRATMKSNLKYPKE